jgi:hypothetical protein
VWHRFNNLNERRRPTTIALFGALYHRTTQIDPNPPVTVGSFRAGNIA